MLTHKVICLFRLVEFDAAKFLLDKASESDCTMAHRPPNKSSSGLPLHAACCNYALIRVITALLAENFATAKRPDENGDLPLCLTLRCGDCNHIVVKTMLTFSCTNMCSENLLLVNGDSHSPLSLALENGSDD